MIFVGLVAITALMAPAAGAQSPLGPLTFDWIGEELEGSECVGWSASKSQMLCFEMVEDVPGTNKTAVIVDVPSGKQSRLRVVIAHPPGSAGGEMIDKPRVLAKLNKRIKAGGFVRIKAAFEVPQDRPKAKGAVGAVTIVRDGERIDAFRGGARVGSVRAIIDDLVGMDEKASMAVYPAGTDRLLVTHQVASGENIHATTFQILPTRAPICPTGKKCPTAPTLVGSYLGMICRKELDQTHIQVIEADVAAGALAFKDLVFLLNAYAAFKGREFKQATYLNDFFYGKGAKRLPPDCAKVFGATKPSPKDKATQVLITKLYRRLKAASAKP